MARLYQRRQAWDRDRNELLAEAVARAPYGPQKDLANLVGFTRPVAQDPELWDRAVAAAGGREELLQRLAQAAARPRVQRTYAPSLIACQWKRQGADEWRLSSRDDSDHDDPASAQYLVAARIRIDGGAHLFCGRAALTLNDVPSLFEVLIAGNFAGFLGMLGLLYELAGFHGHVDVGISVAGIRGARSNFQRSRTGFFDLHGGYGADDYTRTARIAAAELVDAERVTRSLLSRLFEATTGRDDYDPFS